MQAHHGPFPCQRAPGCRCRYGMELQESGKRAGLPAVRGHRSCDVGHVQGRMSTPSRPPFPSTPRKLTPVTGPILWQQGQQAPGRQGWSAAVDGREARQWAAVTTRERDGRSRRQSTTPYPPFKRAGTKQGVLRRRWSAWQHAR